MSWPSCVPLASMTTRTASVAREASAFIRDVRLKQEIEWDALAVKMPKARTTEPGQLRMCSLTMSLAMTLVKREARVAFPRPGH